MTVAMLVLVSLVLAFTGCGRNVQANTPATAMAPATDPYAKGLQAVSVFSQALVSADSAARGLHTTYVVEADGSTHPVIPDDAYGRVQIALRFAAAAGGKLQADLEARLPAATISADLTTLTTQFAAQLRPDQVGVKSAASQAQYLTWVNVINAAVQTLANVISIQTYSTPTAEVRFGSSGDYRTVAVARGFVADYPSADQATAGPTWPSSAPGRPAGTARADIREFRAGAQFEQLAAGVPAC